MTITQANFYYPVTHPLYDAFLFQLNFPPSHTSQDRIVQSIFSKVDFKGLGAFFSTCKNARFSFYYAYSNAISNNSLASDEFLATYLKVAKITNTRWFTIYTAALNSKNLEVIVCIACNPSLPLYQAYWILQWAVREGHLSIVEAMIKRPDIDFTDQEGIKALKTAIFKQNLPILKCLLQDSRVDLSFNQCELVRLAAEQNFMEAVGLMLQDAQVDLYVRDREILRFAIMHKHLPTIQTFLSDPEADGRDLMGHAAESGKLEILQLILQFPHADPTENHCYGFLKVVEKGYIDMVECFLQDERLDPTFNENAAFKRALEYRQYRVLYRLWSDPRVKQSLLNTLSPSKCTIL